MQAKLPDVNAAIVTHRNNMIHAYDDSNYSKALLHWEAINSLLPEEFKVKIDSKEFLKLIAENKVIICPKCNEEIPYKEIKILSILLNTITTLVTSKQYEKVWVCPKCDTENIFKQSDIQTIKYEEPYYTGLIPEPPSKQFGISDRASYHSRFNKWFALASNELESKIGKYRAEYISQLNDLDPTQIVDEDHEK